MYMKKPVNDVNMSYFSEAELRVVKLLAVACLRKKLPTGYVSHATLLIII